MVLNSEASNKSNNMDYYYYFWRVNKRINTHSELLVDGENAVFVQSQYHFVYSIQVKHAERSLYTSTVFCLMLPDNMN